MAPYYGPEPFLYLRRQAGVHRPGDPLPLGLGQGVGGQPYVGFVATNSRIADRRLSTQKQSNVRTRHKLCDLVAIAFVDWNGAVVSNVETDGFGSATVTRAIETAGGDLVQVTWSGATSKVIAAGEIVVSDFMSLPAGMAIGDFFYARRFWDSPSGGIVYNQTMRDGARGERHQYAASGLSDLTMATGVFTNTEAGNSGTISGPSAIIGLTRKGSVALIGDSRVLGQNDNLYADASGDAGILARSVGALGLGYVNGGVSSDRASFYIASHAKREQIFAYASHRLIALGINDIVSASAATVLANLKTIQGYSSQPSWLCTIDPRTTDNTNTVTHSTNASRIALNDLIRAEPSYLEIADIMENGRNGGLWADTSYQADGLHELAAGNLVIQASGVIHAGLFTR